jgi:hypothetical protein
VSCTRSGCNVGNGGGGDDNDNGDDANNGENEDKVKQVVDSSQQPVQ